MNIMTAARHLPWRKATVAAIVGSLSLVMTADPSASAEVGPFRATADAAAMRLVITSANAPGTDTPYDGPGAVAGARLDSLGTSQAFASFPYPGDLAISNAGVVSGVTGLPTLPAYPWYVHSEHPLAPKADQASGPIRLTAQSSEASSAGAATVSFADHAGPGRQNAKTEVSRMGDSIVATSASSLQGFVLGPLSIGSVSSLATVKRTPGSPLERTSSLELSLVRIGDVAVGLTAKGFVSPGTQVPLSGSQLAQVTTALDQAGLTVAYVEQVETPDGIVSAGLRITQRRELPNGMSSVTWLIGQASARVAGRADSTDTEQVNS